MLFLILLRFYVVFGDGQFIASTLAEKYSKPPKTTQNLLYIKAIAIFILNRDFFFLGQKKFHKLF